MLSWILCFLFVFGVQASSKGVSRFKRAPAAKENYIIHPSDVEESEALFDLESLRTLNLAGYIGTLTATDADNARKGINFLAKYKIIDNSKPCEKCNSTMALYKDSAIQHDRLMWKCASCRKAGTYVKQSLRAGSFFEQMKLTVQEVLFLAADWIENPGKNVDDVATHFQINRKTVMEIQECFRRMTEQWFRREAAINPNLLLGGPGKYVEIDETLVYRAKYNRGRMLTRKQVWVFGMLERGSSKIIMFRVKRRNAATLLPLLVEYVLPNTTIVSDGWAAYGGIRNLQSNFDHKWVNHKLNFVNPSDSSAHTQGELERKKGGHEAGSTGEKARYNTALERTQTAKDVCVLYAAVLYLASYCVDPDMWPPFLFPIHFYSLPTDLLWNGLPVF